MKRGRVSRLRFLKCAFHSNITSRTAMPCPPPRFLPSAGFASSRAFVCSRRWPRAECRSWDFALLYLGAAEADFSPAAPPEASIAAEGDDPYFLLRRGFEGGAVMVTARLEWQGGFIVLANDDEAAENLYQQLLAESQPEEVRREWTSDLATLTLFRDLLRAC